MYVETTEVRFFARELYRTQYIDFTNQLDSHGIAEIHSERRKDTLSDCDRLVARSDNRGTG
jgi:hypothetical protein